MSANRWRGVSWVAAVVVVSCGALVLRERVSAHAPEALAGDVDPASEGREASSDKKTSHFGSNEERARWTLRVLSEGFAREERDPEWAPLQEEALRGVREHKRFPAGASLEVECRSAICRLTLTLPAGAPMVRANDLLLAPELGAGGFYGADPDLPGAFRFFVGREGSALQDHPHFVHAVASL